MIINIQDDILKLNNLGLLDNLLIDKTTKGNIMWATSAYDYIGQDHEKNKAITVWAITGTNSDVIKTRARKEMEHRQSRTKTHAEVFTPFWICKKMNDHIDRLNNEVSSETWKKYIDMKCLEITCGEAPFLVSRYDVETGEMIKPGNRIGVLDRKLKIVNLYALEKEVWMEWSIRAFQSTYGYEFQGDNLLIARVNLLMTFEEYYEERWKEKPSVSEYEKIANIIAWNLWQMDGLTGTIPHYEAEAEFLQLSIDDIMKQELCGEIIAEDRAKPLCKIYNWRRDNSIVFKRLREEDRKMKFDFIIGNPPYQDETIGENKTFAPPVYHKFMDSAYEIGDAVELIHPARFLFDAGSTPKDWNRKMLSDEHIKVIYYEADSSRVFSNTDIKGGIAITYRNEKEKFGAIEHFIVFEELRSILSKVRQSGFYGMDNIIYASESYKFTDIMHNELPDVEAKLSKGHKYDFKTSVLDNLNEVVFFDEKPKEGEYVQILGLIKGKRVKKWIKSTYVRGAENFEKYKIFVPAANGSGALGEVLATPVIGQPVIGQPVIGHTQTFISIGSFDTEQEAEACMKYIKSKFCRAMLGILKITQHNPASKWKFVPLQDFTDSSDIDWSKSIADIDKELYKKYGLDETEIEFIETHVKEME